MKCAVCQRDVSTSNCVQYDFILEPKYYCNVCLPYSAMKDHFTEVLTQGTLEKGLPTYDQIRKWSHTQTKHPQLYAMVIKNNHTFCTQWIDMMLWHYSSHIQPSRHR